MHSFKKILAENNEYFSTSAKTKPLPSIYFYLLHTLRIVYKANRQANKKIYDDINWVNSSIAIMESLEKTGVKFHITGMDNIKSFEGPAIFVGNHMSILETFVLPSLIHPIKKVVFVMKEELLKFPLFGPVSGARDPIVVGRQNPREDLMSVLNQGSDRIKNGKGVIIFPQRTRSRFFDASSFNTLGIKLAKKNNVPVVPIAIVSDAWGNGKLLKDFGKIDPSKEVKISFGEPIYIKGNGNEEHQQVLDFIASKFKEWGRSDLIKQ